MKVFNIQIRKKSNIIILDLTKFGQRVLFDFFMGGGMTFFLMFNN